MDYFTVVARIWQFRPFVITLLALGCLLPIIFVIPDETIPESARKCLYVLVVMAVCWVTESVPIPVTALFPLVLFPLLGVLTAKATAAAYVTDTSMLFLGGLIVAVAVEEWQLHKRIAMAVMMVVGSDPKLILAGLMLPTWFLSMWISNTATTSMMLPIASAVLQQMKTSRKELPLYNVVEGDSAVVAENGQDNPAYQGEQPDDKGDKQSSNGGTPNTKVPDDEDHLPRHSESTEDEDEGYARNSKALTLCIAYAANFGGIATLTGTPPNLVLRGAANQLYEDYTPKGESPRSSPISFANWMGMAVPLSFITLILGWCLLVLFFMTRRGCCTKNPQQSMAIKRVIRQEWRKMGRISFAEVVLIFLFLFLAVLWLSRDPKESPGWSVWFKSGYPSDATSAMLIATLLFILPGKIPNVRCCRNQESNKEFYTPILRWQSVHHKLPWGVILLLGGGFSLAKGVSASGLSTWLATKLQSLDWMETWVLNLVLCLIVAAFTEVTSNTATAQILMPILAQLAISLQVNPLYFMASACIATSFAFMLPVATAPNAIVFSFGSIKVIDMTSVGFFMNITAVAALTLCVNTWGDAIYDFQTLDPIFKQNITLGAN